MKQVRVLLIDDDEDDYLYRTIEDRVGLFWSASFDSRPYVSKPENWRTYQTIKEIINGGFL